MRIAAAALATVVAGILSAPVAAYVGQWHSYTDKTHVTVLTEHQGFVYAGTTSGIRRITPATLAETDFDNLDGLLDPWITAFLRDAGGGLWAVARDGYLYALQGTRWNATGRSYASLGWKMNEAAALAAGSHFYLGSEKGLTIFDAVKKISQLNVTRFQNELDVSVLSLLRVGDTLFVGTTRGVFKAAVHFADPLNPPTGQGFLNLADPGAWTLISNDVGYSLSVSGGSVVAGPPGILIESPIRVEAFLGRPVVIANLTYPAQYNVFKTAAVAGGRVFFAGDIGLFVSPNPTGGTVDAQVMGPMRQYPRDSIYNIGANAGVVWGHTPAGLQKFNPSAGTFTPVSSLVPSPSPEVSGRDLRNVAVSPSGDAYVATWGNGLVRQGADSRVWKNSDVDPCIYRDPTHPWLVTGSISNTHGGGLYFTVLKADAIDHQLVHYDFANDRITCPTEGLAVPGAGTHSVRIFSDSLMGVAGFLGVVLFKIREDISGPRLESMGTWTVPGVATDAMDLAEDRWGRPWALVSSKLAFVDSLEESTSRHLTAVDNFSGSDCKHLERDPSGFLWVGCANGLYLIETGIAGNLERVRRYGVDDGLLSPSLFDLSVDPTNGKVWVATDRGVSMLESASEPVIASGTVPVIFPYPNPFRPQHAFVVFGKLPGNSTLRLYNAAGTVVRIFHPRDMTGNEVHWNGKNEQGKSVAPGVYLFSVTSGSTEQRGKVIVAR